MKGPVKAGFAAGRSSNGTTRSSMSSPRKNKPTTKADRAAAKVERAEADIRNLIRDSDVKPWDDEPTGGLVGTPVRRTRPVDPDDDADAAAANGLDPVQARINAKFDALRDFIGVENEDYNAEAANRLLLRSLLSTMMQLYPEAVATYRRTHKEQAGYVVSAFATAARDINAELRVGGDAAEQGTFINTRIIGPMFIAFAQNMLAEGMALKGVVHKQLPNNHPRGVVINAAIDQMLVSLGRFIDASRQRSENDVVSYLNGDLSFVNSETAGGKRKRGRREK